MLKGLATEGKISSNTAPTLIVRETLEIRLKVYCKFVHSDTRI